LDAFNISADYPYTGPDFTSIYYHHIPILLSQVQDCLITQAWKWSNTKISFPSVRQQGYVWFNSRHYGFDKGKFFNEDNMWLWLKEGLIDVNNKQIDWIGARRDGRFAAALMNEDSVDINVEVQLGAEVCVAGPSTLLPVAIEQTGVKVYNTVHEALLDADVVMGLRIQLERQKKGLFPSIREYSRFFGLDEKRLKLAKKDALILHPGPVNRGVELSSQVVDGEQSLINEQVTNGVAVRMALLYLLTRRGSSEDID
jgi:hypothetical protein